jgi:hypothetical protein
MIEGLDIEGTEGRLYFSLIPGSVPTLGCVSVSKIKNFMKRFLILLLAVIFLQCDNDSVDECSTFATVRDLTGFDGCRFVFELEDGSKIEPIRPFIFCGTPPHPKKITEDPLYNFEFIDGKKVRLSYTITNNVSICMVGPVVKINCITDVAPPSGEE